MIRTGQALWIVGLLLCGCSRSLNRPAPQMPHNNEELRQAIGAILVKYRVPSAGVALISKDQTIFAEAIGKTDPLANVDADSETIYRVASITKTLVALAMLKLEEEGRIDLNAKVTDIAPELPLRNPWQGDNPVRVVNLLEHTSGLPDCTRVNFYDFRTPPVASLSEAFGLFPDLLRVRSRPGEREAYSNPGYGLLGYLIEKASGQSYDEYITRSILQPLGMTHSGFDLSTEKKVHLAIAYAGTPRQPVEYRPILFGSAAQLLSTPADMARFVHMMLDRGTLDGMRLVSSDSIARMEKSGAWHLDGAACRGFGGMGIGIDLNHRIKGYSETGGIDGFLSQIVYLPEAKSGYFLSTTSTSWGGGLAFSEIERLVFDFLTRGVADSSPPSAPLSPEAVRWSGYYTPLSPGDGPFKFIRPVVEGQRIVVRDGTLFRESIFGQDKQALVPTGPNQFRLASEPDTSVCFFQKANGSKMMASLSGGRFEQVSAWWPAVRLLLLSTAFGIIWSAIPVGAYWTLELFWHPRWDATELALKFFPMIAPAAFLGSRQLLRYSSTLQMAMPNVRTAGFFLGTLVFAFSSILSLLLTLRLLRAEELGLFSRVYSALLSFASSGMALYLAYWGVIGYRFWRA